MPLILLDTPGVQDLLEIAYEREAALLLSA